jgi:hypothetical protein
MSATATDWSEPDARKLVKRRLIGAVGQNRAFSLAGLGERVFARLSTASSTRRFGKILKST